jgi:hypothetical protein
LAREEPFAQGYRQGFEDGRRHVAAVAVGVIFPPDAIAAIVPSPS